MPEPEPPVAMRDLFEISLAAETQGRDFYLRMSRSSPRQPDIGEFWRSLMLDESRHIGDLKRIQAEFSADQLDAPIDPRVVARARTALAVLTPKRTREVATLEDVYELAHEYESSELNHLFTFLAVCHVASEDRRSVIVHEIRDHQAKLSAFTEQFGDRKWRGSIRVVPPASQPAGPIHPGRQPDFRESSTAPRFRACLRCWLVRCSATTPLAIMARGSLASKWQASPTP